MGMLIVGIIFVGVAIILFFLSRSQAKMVDQMIRTERTTAKDLAELARSVSGDLGSGSFCQKAEVKGKAVCDKPLRSELAQVDCVYYSMSVTREYEEAHWATDSEGRRSQETRRGSETLASNTRSLPFYVEDATGKILLEPSGAQVIPVKVFSRFDQGEPHSGTVSIGSFSLNFGTVGMLAGGRRTLGHRYEEQAIPTKQEIYVLGEASDKDGELKIRMSTTKGEKFVISTRSEEELVQGAEKSGKALRIAAVVLAVGGIVLAIAELFV